MDFSQGPCTKKNWLSHRKFATNFPFQSLYPVTAPPVQNSLMNLHFLPSPSLGSSQRVYVCPPCKEMGTFDPSDLYMWQNNATLAPVTDICKSDIQHLFSCYHPPSPFFSFPSLLAWLDLLWVIKLLSNFTRKIIICITHPVYITMLPRILEVHFVFLTCLTEESKRKTNRTLVDA